MGYLGTPSQTFKVHSLRKYILQHDFVLPVHSDITHRCWRIKSCRRREIYALYLDMLPCNPKINLHFYHLVMWGNFLLSLCFKGLGKCFLPPYHNIWIFLLCVQFDLLTLLVVLVACWSVSFYGHLHHMYFLDLDLAYAVDFLVVYNWIGKEIILHIQALIGLHIVLCITILLSYKLVVIFS